ncbi:hypothetical protein JOB18_020438 [Solea senegalensis]|uniref:Uncharacterized protein n=1 Tax=Solea senegalensis TaxID=28829 RepID=A0AAV6PZX8_SOLSE|nr:hypothetical protein JOB18_020438 [Solea senegalensis]
MTVDAKYPECTTQGAVGAEALIQNFEDWCLQNHLQINRRGLTKKVDATIKELIPRAGPRLKFLKKFRGLEIWYTPGRSYRPPTGFLEERLRNIRRLRSTSRLQRTAQTPPQTLDDGALVRAFIPECNISDERASQLKEWLRNNSQPFSQVETYMQDTAVYRAKRIRDNNWTIDQSLEEFPHLMTKGVIVLHGDAESKLFETWLPIYAEKILHLARREGKLTLPLDGLTPDAVGELALRQLPALLPPTAYKVGRGAKVVRHTIAECNMAFIDHKPPGTNMVKYLHEARLRPYPYVLILGNDDLDSSQAR